MKVIVVESGTRSVLHFDRAVIRIGRALDNDIRLSDKLVSRNHCRIEVGPEGPWVIDLGAANGTMINGERVRRHSLRPGDELRVGNARIQLEIPGSEPGPGDTQRIDPEPEEAEAGGAAAQNGDTRAGGRDATSGFGSVALATQTGEALRERENLRVFAQITRRLVRETELMALLRLIVDSAVSLVGAERGFLLLAEEPGERDAADRAAAAVARNTARDASAMRVRVARNFDHSDIPVPSSRLSMGIANQVVRVGRPVLTVDAGRDDRFKGMASVEDLRLRSVMCLPVEIGGSVDAVLYLDNRLQQGAFTEDDLDLVELFAAQAAIAIRNARALAEIVKQNHKLVESRAQIARLNEQLGRKVRDRDQELAVVRAELERERGRYDYSQIVGASDGMRTVFHQLDRIIESDLPVLIHGDSGTGKELIARAIHFNGVRKDKPFVSENCAALPDSLLESELFGYTRGAFTGADRTKKGLFEQAAGGTLFLDEIGDMSVEMQKKLLRVLQEDEVRPLGSDHTVKVDVRLLAASHRDLEEMVRKGEFREDLYYRVNVLTVSLPPLRERREDIPLLAETMLARAAREAGRTAPILTHEALATLVSYDWPGNVRELENEMRRLVVMAGEQVTSALLSDPILASARSGGAELADPTVEVGGDLRAAVARFECRAIEGALTRQGDNKSRAAAELGISRFALQRKLDKYGLASSDDDEG